MSDKAQEAAGLLDHPLLVEILENLERTALDEAVGGYPRNPDSQRDGLAKAYAVRALRSELKRHTVEPAKPSRKGLKA